MLTQSSLSFLHPPVLLLTDGPTGMFYSIHIPKVSAAEGFVKTICQSRAVYHKLSG